MKKNFIFLSLFCLVFSSCSSHPKKSGTKIFLEDSDFLKHGRKIEVYKEKETELTKEEEIEEKKTIVVEEKPLEKKTESKKVKEQKTQTVQKPQEEKKPEVQKSSEKAPFPFGVGEEVVLSASFFGVEAGKIYVGVDNFMLLDGQKQYNFYAIGKTTSVFSLFYRVKNKIESLWDPKLKLPRTIAFDAKETKQKYKARAYFDWKKSKAQYYEEGWDHKKGNYKNEKEWDLKIKGQDIVSSIFYVRTLPLEVGQDYKVTVFEESKVIEVTLHVDRAETLKTRLGKFETLVLKPTFKTNGKFKKVGDISIWLTNDKHKQVVRVESKIKIGTVVASLHSMKRP